VEQAETLRTIAEVATAFAGFSGVVLVLGRRTEREWSYVETATISLLLFFSLGVVFLALVPLLVEAAGVPVWRISNGLFGIYHLALIIWVGKGIRGRTDRLLVPRWLAIAALAGGFGTVVFNLLVAAGALQPLSFFAYLVAIVWLLGMAAMMFAALLFESRRDAAASPLPAQLGT
jgi:hypothetical protein